MLVISNRLLIISTPVGVKENNKKNKDRCVLALGRLTTDRINSVANGKTRIAVAKMREDQVTQLIRCDHLLMTWTNKVTTKYKLDQDGDMIRSLWRLFRRFPIAVKTVDQSIDDFISLFNPKYYDATIEAVNMVAGLNDENGTYRAPSNGCNLGTFIKMLDNHLIGLCVRNHDRGKKIYAKDFLKLHEEDYGPNVNRIVTKTQIRNDCKKRTILPTDSDIKKLYNYLQQERRTSFVNLKEQVSKNNWTKLARLEKTREESGEITKERESHLLKREV